MKAEMLILGALHRGRLHPYEIKRRLTNAMVECFTDVDVGTLYYAVRQLAKAKLIRAVSQRRVAQGGIKTHYALTKAGRARFQDLLNGCFAADGAVAETLYVAMLFLHLGDAKHIAELLRVRIARQKATAAKMADIKRQFQPLLGTGGLWLLKHLEVQRNHDLKWLRGLLVEMSAGKVCDLPEPARLRLAATIQGTAHPSE